METGKKKQNSKDHADDKLNNPSLKSDVKSTSDEGIQNANTYYEKDNGRKKVEWKKTVKNYASRYINKIIDPLTVATIILAFFTYKLFNDAAHSNEANQIALKKSDSINRKYLEQIKRLSDASLNTFNEQTTMDSFNKREQRRKDSMDNISMILSQNSIRTNDSINRVTLAQQIKSFKADSISRAKSDSLSLANLITQENRFKEANQEFKIANAPYIECRDFVIKIHKKGVVPTFSFDVYNTGTTVFKIDSINDTLSIVKDIDTSENFKISSPMQQFIRYVTKESPVKIYGSGVHIYTSPKIINSLMFFKGYTFFLYGVINYSNEAMGIKKQYRFWVMFFYPWGHGYYIVKSENTDIN